ncbi:MAG: CRTAC1 family protein [Chloroflexota bacterium]|nr:CRTAC1 family protein [Chloroflexota bacterium]
MLKAFQYTFVMLTISATLMASAQGENPIFRDVSAVAGIMATHRGVWDDKEAMQGYLAIGQAWGDYDRDGWVDLFVTGNLDPNALYRNQGDGTFSLSEHSLLLSLPDVPSGGAVWADYDNDGWLDLYIVNYGANRLFRNEGGRGFRDVTLQAGVGDTGKGTSAAWGDYDRDGWLDLYVTNWSCFPECDPVDFTLQQDRLYHNNGDGSFTDVTASLDYAMTLGAGFAPAFLDYDGDGDSDIYVVNDKLQNEIGNVLWRNDGVGCGHWCWTNVSAESGADLLINGMGVDASDYDNDGDLDLYITDMVYQMHLLMNDGAGGFRNRARSSGSAINMGPDNGVGWGAVFFDFDNDGWQDLYVAATNYHQTFPELEVSFMNPRADALFRNDRHRGFRDVSAASGLDVDLPTLGVAYADYDRDGDLDLVTGNWNSGYRLLQNQGGGGRWLSLDLRGNNPTLNPSPTSQGGTAVVNRDAVGSTVYVTTPDGLAQQQTVSIGAGLGGNNQLALHFGLGDASAADLRILWTNGAECSLEAVPANQRLRVVYGVTAGCG